MKRTILATTVCVTMFFCLLGTSAKSNTNIFLAEKCSLPDTTNFAHKIEPPKYWKNLFDSIYYKHYGRYSYKVIYQQYSTSANSAKYYYLANGIDALNTMYQTSLDTTYLNEAIRFTKNVLKSAVVSNQIENSTFKDSYLGWPDINEPEKVNGQEIPLCESIFFKYVLKTLYIIKENKKLYATKEYQEFYETTLNFIEENIWNKWYHRGESNLIRSRTHMASHWAFIAMYLEKLSENNTIKNQCSEIKEKLNQKFKKQLVVDYKNNCIWNQTWDDEVKKPIVQDVNHGNHFVSYLVESTRLNDFFTTTDLMYIENTLLNIIWDSESCYLHDNIDGTDQGNKKDCFFVADGFMKMAEWNKALFLLFQDKKATFLTNYQPQFYANMYNLSTKYSRKNGNKTK